MKVVQPCISTREGERERERERERDRERERERCLSSITHLSRHPANCDDPP